MSTKRVTGIGGIFFKCKDPDKMKDWYGKHLGFKTDEYGTMFEFRDTDNPGRKGYLQWSPFPEKQNISNHRKRFHDKLPCRES